MKLSNQFFGFLFILALFTEGYSQNRPSGVSPDEPVYDITFRLLSDRGGIEELYLQPPARPGVEPEYILVPSHRFTQWKQYTGVLPIPVYKKGETQILPPEVPGGQEVEVPRPVAYLNPPSSGKWLFMLQKSTDNQGRLFFKSYPIRDESTDLTSGYLIINLSEADFAIQMNEELHQVPGGGRKHFLPSPKQNGRVDLRIAENQGGVWKMINSNTIKMPENLLTIMFLTKDARRVWIRRIVDKPIQN